MKKMVLNTVVLLVAVNNSVAQTTAYCIRAGALMSTITCKTDSGRNGADYLPGFSAGLFTDFPLAKHLSFQTGMSFTAKGARNKSVSNGNETTVNTRMNYISFPLDVIYYSQKQYGFFAGGGLTIAFALTGKISYDYPACDSFRQDKTERIKYGLSETDHFKSLDLGIHLVAGYAFKRGLTISISHFSGLANLSTVEGVTKRNHLFALQLGFLLKQKS